MENHKNGLSGNSYWASLRSFKDEVTYNKIQRHLTDINDVISEDDIRNIKIYAGFNELEITATQKQKQIVH